MATTIGGDSVQYPDGTVQKQKKQIIKTRYTSSATYNHALTSGSDGDIPDLEIDMGAPEKSNNWYRCEYYTVTDDWAPGTGYGGMGYAIWRHTPSAGWTKMYSQGQNANYDNNAGDWYASPVGLWYVPAHPTYPSEPHSFKISGRRHPGQAPNPIRIRVNSSIGYDNRIGGWQNNMFSVSEIDGDMVVNNTLTVF